MTPSRGRFGLGPAPLGGDEPKSWHGSTSENGVVRPGREPMVRKSKRPAGGRIRGGRGVPRHRRADAKSLARADGRRNTAVDFDAINAAAMACLPALCARWLPDGRRVGREWEARNPCRVDRRPGSFKVNLKTGRWADFALPDARGGDPVSLAAYLSGQSQSEAARALAEMLGVAS